MQPIATPNKHKNNYKSLISQHGKKDNKEKYLISISFHWHFTDTMNAAGSCHAFFKTNLSLH